MLIENSYFCNSDLILCQLNFNDSMNNEIFKRTWYWDLGLRIFDFGSDSDLRQSSTDNNYNCIKIGLSIHFFIL
jgi:hypothetical protein